jgi:hypothetical protein
MTIETGDDVAAPKRVGRIVSHVYLLAQYEHTMIINRANPSSSRCTERSFSGTQSRRST